MSSEELLKEIKNAGLADDAAISRIKKESALYDKSVEEIAASSGLVDDRKLAELKAKILKVPYKKADTGNLDKKLFEILPEETARSYGVAPLEIKENMLVVGMVYPDDEKAQDALKFLARQRKLNLGVYLISYGDWRNILKNYSSYRTEIERAVQSLNLRSGEGVRRVVGLEEGGASGEEAPIIRIVADTLKQAVQGRASDVHIEPSEDGLKIRFRVDGELHEEASLPAELSQLIVSRVKVISDLKLDETRIPQDGRFRSKISGKDIDFRVSTFPTPLGEKVAIRILDPATGLRRFEDLPLLYANKKKVEAGLNKPFGMVLVTGPTGSGKTTSLYAMLQRLNEENVNIVSLEDPIEYFIPGVNQSQVRPEIGYDFASGLRQILRQDPDIIMVGEIRDDETAGLVVHAALTGHIVLSTLHTNNAVSVIPRLMDMKIKPFLLPASLILMISQRLVGAICQNCKAENDPTPAIFKEIKNSLSDLSEEISKNYKEPYKIYRGKGCDKCKGRGTFGRIALFEVLEMTPGMEQIINAAPTAQNLLKEAKNQGMMTLRQDGVLKALKGEVLIEEVLRETEEL